VEGREGLGRRWDRVIRVSAGAGVHVLAGEVAEKDDEERDDDGVATEDRVPLLDLGAEQLLHEHLLRSRGFCRSYPSHRRHCLTVWARFPRGRRSSRADVAHEREKVGRRENTAEYEAVEASFFFTSDAGATLIFSPQYTAAGRDRGHPNNLIRERSTIEEKPFF
jgi:hypothetical protein